MSSLYHMDEICVICGGRYGLHNAKNKACPVNINATADHTEYQQTAFKPTLKGDKLLISQLEEEVSRLKGLIEKAHVAGWLDFPEPDEIPRVKDYDESWNNFKQTHKL